MKDLQGREYLKCEGLQPNTLVECDGGFTCIGKGSFVVIFQDTEGSFYFHCAEGTHHLEGQISDDETHYIGLYNV